MIKHYPKDQGGNNSILELNRGLNLEDNYLKMIMGESAILRNLRYNKNTPIKRAGFTQWNNQSWNAYGIFKSAHEYIDLDGSVRILVGSNNGVISEVSTTTRVSRVAGLSSSKDIRFASALGRVISTNGTNSPRVGDKTVWREFGALPAVSDLSVSASGSGSFDADFLHIVIPVKEIETGVAEIYGDWSNIETTTAVSNSQFDLTWTDVSDSRVDKYWIFRTRADVSGPFYYVASVNPGVGVYTDTTTDANLSEINSPIRGLWGPSPVSKYVAYSGNRIAMANISGEENGIHVSQLAANKYDVEAFPTTGNRVYAPGNGPILGIKSIGDRGADTRQTNHLFIGQKSSTYILPESDPKQPIITVSEEIGLINDKAIAQWSSYIFWVDPKNGLMFWRFGQERPWKIGDKINPIFFGGGNQKLNRNQNDSDITLNVYDDQLFITVRDESASISGNKTYLMDLNTFTPSDEYTAQQSARFTGPWSNDSLGTAFYVPMADRSLLLFDNENLEILSYDDSSVNDYIGGVDTIVKPRILTGSFLTENLRNRKSLIRVWIYSFADDAPTLTVKGEFGNLNTLVSMIVPRAGFEWDDIEWDDIEWTLDGWYAEGSVSYGEYSAWFQLDIEWTTANNDLAIFGYGCEYMGHKQKVTYY